MKKFMLLFLSLFAVFALILASCGGDDEKKPGPGPGDKTEFSVRFYNGDTEYADLKSTVEDGKKATKPADPVKANYNVEGWYKEKEFTTKWNFESDTVTANIRLYVKWVHTEDVLPADADIARAEKVTLVNAWYVVYEITLPAGKKWSDYKGLKAYYMLGQKYLDEGVARGIRVMGPYKGEDFTFCTTNASAPPADQGIRLAAADYNGNKNAEYILDNNSNGTGWGGSDLGSLITALNSAIGYDPEAYQWFDVNYVIDGSKKGNDYIATLLDNTATGPFYFGLGLPGQGPSDNQTSQENVFYIRDVTLIGFEASDNVVGKPLYFKYQGNEYPAYTGYPHVNAAFGTKEVKREIVDTGLQKAVVDVTWDPIICTRGDTTQ